MNDLPDMGSSGSGSIPPIQLQRSGLPHFCRIHTLSPIDAEPFALGRSSFTGFEFMAKNVYSFGGKTADGNGKMKELLGGKGANLAEMCLIGMPVPPGFTITTEVCAAYYANNRQYPK